MSAETEYMGGATRDIPAAVSALTSSKLLLARRILPILGRPRILATLRRERGAGCYTGLDNTS